MCAEEKKNSLHIKKILYSLLLQYNILTLDIQKLTFVQNQEFVLMTLKSRYEMDINTPCKHLEKVFVVSPMDGF